jgi:hypothetical protein
MTYEEILNKLGDLCAFDVRLYGALINAVEKQIPQKIKREPHICLHSSNLLHYTYHCPVCGALVKDREGWNYPNEKEAYCYRCGQRLDWGEK